MVNNSQPVRWLDPDLVYAILAEFAPVPGLSSPALGLSSYGEGGNEDTGKKGNPLAVWPMPLWTNDGQKILFYSPEQLLAATKLPPGRWVDPILARHILDAADSPDCWPIILYNEGGTRPVLFHSAEELQQAINNEQ